MLLSDDHPDTDINIGNILHRNQLWDSVIRKVEELGHKLKKKNMLTSSSKTTFLHATFIFIW